MSTGKPNNFSWISPNLTVTDADAAIDFYKKAFGIEVLSKVPGDDGKTIHAELKYKDQTLMLAKEGMFDDGSDTLKTPTNSGVPSPTVLYCYHENVDALYKQALAAGAKTKQEPNDMFWGDRTCIVRDLDGHTWCFATNLRPHG